jgi:hypothetical protein
MTSRTLLLELQLQLQSQLQMIRTTGGTNTKPGHHFQKKARSSSKKASESIDETPTQRTARLIEAADRLIAEIMDSYEHAKATAEQYRAAKVEYRAKLLASIVKRGYTGKRLKMFLWFLM